MKKIIYLFILSLLALPFRLYPQANPAGRLPTNLSRCYAFPRHQAKPDTLSEILNEFSLNKVYGSIFLVSDMTLQYWDGSNWINRAKFLYSYDANYNWTEFLYL